MGRKKGKRSCDADGLEEAARGGVALEALGAVELDDVGDARRAHGGRGARQHGPAKERGGREDVRHARAVGVGGAGAHGTDERGRGLGRREARRGGGEDVARGARGAVEAVGREQRERLEPGDGARGGHGTRGRAHLGRVAHHNAAHRSVSHSVFFCVFVLALRGGATEGGLARPRMAADTKGHGRRHREGRKRHRKHRSKAVEVLLKEDELCEFSDGSDTERVELEKALEHEHTKDKEVVDEEGLCEFSDGSDVERAELEKALEHKQSKDEVAEEEEGLELCEFSDGSDVERVELEKAQSASRKTKKHEKHHTHTTRHGAKKHAKEEQSQTQTAVAEVSPAPPVPEEHHDDETAPTETAEIPAETPAEKEPEQRRTSVSSIREMFEQLSASSQPAPKPAPARRPRTPSTGLRTSLHVYRRIEEECSREQEQHEHQSQQHM